MFPPGRIVCLTEETVETLYLLGEQDRIVGISGYVVRPPQARRQKPRVSGFTSANIDKILALKPDLVLTFSDLQAGIVADLIRRGLDVHAFNQRSIAGILDMIRMLGAMVDASERARQLVGMLERRLADARSRAERLPKRPRVFFEEWDDPLISGIGWVSELVEIAGGIDIFADRRHQGAAKDRVVTAEEVVSREPDLIIGSWCGKKFRPERVAARAGFGQVPAVRYLDLYEIKSSLILQPGPAALTDGLAELQRIIERWQLVLQARPPGGLEAGVLLHANLLQLITCAVGSPCGGEMERINIAEKFARFSEQWQPKIVAELNGQEVKLVKVQGTFPWHHHDDAEEMFLGWRGRFRVEFRDRIVELGPGEFVVEPRGVEHRTAATKRPK